MLLNFILANGAVLLLMGVLALLLYKKRKEFSVLKLRILATIAIVGILYLFASWTILSYNYATDVYWFAYLVGWPLSSICIGLTAFGILFVSAETLVEEHGKKLKFIEKFFDD